MNVKWRGRAAAGQNGGIQGLGFSVTHRCTDIGSWERMLFFGKSVSLGFLFSQAPSTEHIRPDGGEGYIWKPLRSPCPLLRGHVALRVWWGMAPLSSSQQGGGFGLVVEWHLVKKTTKGKWGGLGFHLKNLNPWVKNFQPKVLNQHCLGVSISVAPPFKEALCLETKLIDPDNCNHSRW